MEELELTADYLAKVAEEKERSREEKARLREEEITRREYERDQERLRKELAHYETAATAMRDHFQVHPADVRDVLTRPDASIVTWMDEPEALEWRQSEQARRQPAPLPAGSLPHA